MKVLILNSPLFRESNPLYDEDSLPPLGLAYIATELHKDSIEVELVDAVYERISVASVVTKINTDKPEFVAVNIFTTNKALVKEIIESITYQTHFIIGGLATKNLYTQIFEWNTTSPIDVVTGDGEYITKAIVTNNLLEEPLMIYGNRRVFQVNDKSKYLVSDISSVPLDRSFLKNEPVKHHLGFIEANIIASRGCIYNCAFCAAARSENSDLKPRERSDESLITELAFIQKQFPGVNSIRVLDDLFLKNNLSIQQAINVFTPFSFQWRSMAHVLTFKNASDEMIRELKDSGCHELFIGIESGSPKILKQIRKVNDIPVIFENLGKVLRAGVNIKGYFIYGFPGETIEDMDLTYDLALRLKQLAAENGVNFRTSVFQFRPYDGTELHHRLQDQGANLKVHPIQPDPDLSSLVGRLQFNFHSGNYSEVDDQTLKSYIYRTTNLNDGKLFADLKPYWQPS